MLMTFLCSSEHYGWVEQARQHHNCCATGPWVSPSSAQATKNPRKPTLTAPHLRAEQPQSQEGQRTEGIPTNAAPLPRQSPALPLRQSLHQRGGGQTCCYHTYTERLRHWHLWGRRTKVRQENNSKPANAAHIVVLEAHEPGK